ncbi:MAG: hypothetical protein N2042_02510 [Thermodesulfovibrio sp.]|nr:hypothetical protein [Thermodesulfovibrio sp.]
MIEPQKRNYWGRGKGKKQIKDVKELSNGWYLIKTENSKSKEDFKVKVIFSLKPQKSMTPKHAHFLIDFYGKLCFNKEATLNLLRAIYEVWKGENPQEVYNKYKDEISDLPGYPIEYIIFALHWILEQEDINFESRPRRKQEELNKICSMQNITTPDGRLGSQLAIALLCDVVNGTHPVEALLKANLDIRPKGKFNKN